MEPRDFKEALNKAKRALHKYYRENHLDPAKDYSKDPIHGKFGSRHQAALGISETSDAITILVSEETGNVSIAFNGRMSTYLKGDFIEEIKADYDEIEKREDKKVSKFLQQYKLNLSYQK